MTRGQIRNLLVVTLLWMPGCIPSIEPSGKTLPIGLQMFASEKAFLDYYKTAVVGPKASSTQPSAVPYSPGAVVASDPVGDTVGGLATSSGSQLPDASLPALARTNGSLIYMISDYDLSVVKADPPGQISILGRFNLQDWPQPSALYVFGQRAVIVTQCNYAYGYGWTYMIGDDWLPNGDTFFEVGVFDVSDPANPKLLRHYWIEGEPLASQVVNGRLILVSATYPADPYNSTIPDMTTATAESILPRFRMVDENSNETIEPLVTWKTVRRPAEADGSAVTTISTLDVTGAPSKPASTAVMAFWEYLYMTPTALYMTNAPNDANQEPRTDTGIHKYTLTGAAAEYVASGKVTGRPVGYWYSYSNFMSEKDGLLRMVVERDAWTQYDVVILKQGDTQLEVMGQAQGVAPELAGPSFQFVGNHLLASDYDPSKQPVDVDLTDPANPTVTGPIDLLHVVGWMHMLDETHILAVGKETLVDDSGNVTYGDLGMWMFDLTDIAKPVVLHHEVIGSGATQSAVACSCYRNELTLAGGLMALPVYLFEGTYPPNQGILTFGGQYIYRISLDKGFEQLGRIETLNAHYYDSWESVFFQNNAVYVVSDVAAKAASQDDPSQMLSDIRVPGL